MRKTHKLRRELETKLASGPERGGIILRSGRVVEFPNICEDPLTSCMFNMSEFIPHMSNLAATWHTHPDATADLSGMDWESFSNWPELEHVIVGSDGLRWYAVAENGAVIRAS